MRAPIKNAKLESGREFVDLQVVDPHDIVHYLFDIVGIDIPAAFVKSFWQHHRAVQSPWLEMCDATDQHVPLGLYADAAMARQQAYRARETVFGIWLNLPLWKPKSTRFSRWLLFSLDESLSLGRATLNPVWGRIVWSVNHLFFGLFPRRGPSNECLGKAGERGGQNVCSKDGVALRFAVTEIRGDWKFFKDALGLQSSWKGGSKKSICFKCTCMQDGPNPYYDVDNMPPEHSVAEFLVKETPAEDVCRLARLSFQKNIISRNQKS